MGWDTRLRVPWDTDFAVVAGHHRKKGIGDNINNHEVNIITAKIPKEYDWLYSDLIDHTEKEGVPYGYPVHFSCWILVRRFIGPQAEMNVDSFVKVLSKRVKIPPGGEFDRWMNSGSLPPSIIAFDMHLLNDKINIEWIFRFYKIPTASDINQKGHLAKKKSNPAPRSQRHAMSYPKALFITSPGGNPRYDIRFSHHR
jgi:hypothetical protein